MFCHYDVAATAFGHFTRDPPATPYGAVMDAFEEKQQLFINIFVVRGVGFSYDPSGVYDTNDDKTADDNYLAIQAFFRKFPTLRKKEFYITGESYGGVYVPMLTQRLLKAPKGINLRPELLLSQQRKQLEATQFMIRELYVIARKMERLKSSGKLPQKTAIGNTL
ncbi:hypothetical protein HPB48_018504 [Haemaphysalis longicornis]|uniref:Carboxypeptidase n=1 Tax=Haemaphysalis longicornis TaxID=44386 RepID=A0A9J6GP36_HAELO|nr:hypothetical protein HPB48_018504 [Haemaphysalis longicornis]